MRLETVVVLVASSSSSSAAAAAAAADSWGETSVCWDTGVGGALAVLRRSVRFSRLTLSGCEERRTTGWDSEKCSASYLGLLDNVVAKARRADWLKAVEPPETRAALAAASASARCTSDRRDRPRVAVLLTGAARTFGASVPDYAELVASVKSRSEAVHVFAFLDLGNKIVEAAASSHQEAASSFSPSSSSLPPQTGRVSRAFGALYRDLALTRDEATRHLAALGAPFDFEAHTDDHPLLLSVGAFGALDPAWRASAWVGARLKVAAAVAMMRRHEEAQASVFDVVIRLRPDLCLGGRLRAFFDHALARPPNGSPRTHCASIVVFRLKDAAFVTPRWAAEAIADEWRPRLAPFSTAPLAPAAWLPNATSCLVDVDVHTRLSSLKRCALIRRPQVGCSTWS